VGYARTATIAAMHPAGYSREKAAELRIGYYRYIAEGGPLPSVTVIQDLDPQRGYGAWWGEVNSSVHKGLGSLGVVTDGSIRDLPDCASGFQLIAGMVGPSHAHVHVVSYGGEVNVAGMAVQDRDLIHADQHGAVVIPSAVADKVKAAADLIARREAVLIEAARQPGFDFEKLQQAWAGMAEIH
jgi:regulator of RNase E activity RraA